MPRRWRLLLRLYPPSFRERFGAEMLATMEQAWQGRRSAWARAAFLVDAISTAARERIDDWRHPRDAHAINPATTTGSMDTILQDVRFAARSLGRRPGLVIAITLTLALGIGANTAVFSLIDAVLLHPLPVVQPEQLVAVYHARTESAQYEATPYPMYRLLDEQTRSLEGLAGFLTIDIGVRSEGRSEHVQVAAVSGDYFAVLGVKPQAGRLLSPADEGAPGANPVVVLSDQAWTRLFDRSPRAIGATLRAGEQAYTIIGVAPAAFRGTELAASPQLFFPITMVTSLGEGGLYSGRMAREVFTTTAFGWVKLVGRLRQGATRSQVAQELNTVAHEFWKGLGAEAAGREKLNAPVSVFPIVQAASLADQDNLVRFVAILLMVVALTLLIACVNVANLMLMRSAERARELALRMALGANRIRIVRQLFVESLILALLGALAGLAVGVATMRLLSTFTLPGEIALAAVGLSLDLRVLAFTGITAMAAAIVFGLVPAVRASNLAPGAALKTQTLSGQRRPRGILVAAQVAMSLVLLVGATLFVRSLQAGLRTDIGFDPTPLAAVSADVRVQGYDRDRERVYFREAEALAKRVPGVLGAAVGASIPLADLPRLPFSPVSGDAASAGRERVTAGYNVVSAGFFDALGIALMQGRVFTASDDHAAPRVAVVNEAAARALSPDRPILGRTIRLMGSIEFSVVGIVRNTKVESVRDVAVPVVFAHLAQQSPTNGASIVIRSDAPAASLASLQRAMRSLDPNVPIRNPRLVVDQLDLVLMPQRFGATLLGVFALVALAVSAVGIYGVVAYAVSQRQAELGIRIALGARRGDIVRAVAFRSGLAVAVGMLAGGAAAVAGTRGVEHFLFGITRLDPMSFVVATTLLGVAAAAACWGPVRRAIAVDPLTAIRSE